jgi:cytochrome b561
MMPEGRYTTVAIVLHWLVAAIVLGQFVLGWQMQEIPKQPPGQRAEVFNLHKSIGMVIFALMVARIAWRLGHPPPALPAMPAWQAKLANATHILLYAVLIALPVTGYLGSAFSGYPVKFFGVALPAWAAKNPEMKEWMSAVHLALTWTLFVAFTLHMAGAAKHAFIERDGLLRRMSWKRAPD